MLNMNERMNESFINIVRLFNFTRSAILPHNLPKLYSTGRFSWSTICYCAGGRGLKVLNGTRPVEYTQYYIDIVYMPMLMNSTDCKRDNRHNSSLDATLAAWHKLHKKRHRDVSWFHEHTNRELAELKLCRGRFDDESGHCDVCKLGRNVRLTSEWWGHRRYLWVKLIYNYIIM